MAQSPRGFGGEVECDEALKVDRGAAVGPSELVAFDTSVSQFAPVVPDEPREGPFDHGAALAVFTAECFAGGLAARLG